MAATRPKISATTASSDPPRRSTPVAAIDSAPAENTTPGTHDAIAEWLFSLPDIHRVLDAPSGHGAMAARCADRGYQVTAADCEPDCDLREADFQRVDFRQVDLNHRLPFDNRSFDAVISIDGIEHLERPYDFVEESARILRPGGWLIISTPNISALRSRMRWLLTGFHNKCKVPLDETDPNPLHHVNMLSFPKLRYMLHRSGFHVRHVTSNRVKAVGLAYAWLAPLSWLATAGVFHREEPDPAQRRRNVEIHRQLHSWHLLFGETMIVMARREESTLTPPTALRESESAAEPGR